MTKIEFNKIKEEILETEFLWRYMDLHKFFSVIDTHRTPFNRVDLFDDLFETVTIDELLSSYHLWRSYKDVKDDEINPILPPELIEDIQKRRDHSHNFVPQPLIDRQKIMYASCWYLNSNESIAMWDLYSNPDSVAIKVKPSSLFDSLEKNSFIVNDGLDNNNIYGGKIIYHPFQDPNFYFRKKDFTGISLGFRKDKSYEHEREFRFIFQSSIEMQLLRIEIFIENFSSLDCNIVTHPRMAKWKKENIEAYCKDKGIKVLKSDILTRSGG